MVSRDYDRFKRPLSLLKETLMPQETLRRKQLKVDFGDIPDLNFLQHLRFQVFGKILLRWAKPAGYSGAVPVYLVKCSRHGLYLDTPHGNRKYFQCHSCLVEAKEEADKKRLQSKPKTLNSQNCPKLAEQRLKCF